MSAAQPHQAQAQESVGAAALYGSHAFQPHPGQHGPAPAMMMHAAQAGFPPQPQMQGLSPEARMQLALEARSPPVSVEDDWRYRLEWCGKHLFASETVLDRCDIPKEATIMLVPRVHALVR